MAMELKATLLGKHLAQHPYNRVRLLTGGVEVSGERHRYLIPFNQLLAINCKRGLVWGELEFVLPDNKVVRLHGTEWQATQRFYHHLESCWHQWSQEMAGVAATALNTQLDVLVTLEQSDGWLHSAELDGIQSAIRQTLASLPLPYERTAEFPDCQPGSEACLRWLNQSQQCRTHHNRLWTERMLSEHRDFFATLESSPLNAAQAQAVVNGEQNLLVLAGPGSGKTSILIARIRWLLMRKEATEEQILLLAFGRVAAAEMAQRLSSLPGRPAVCTQTFHALALYILEHSGRKPPRISELEQNAEARQTLIMACWQEQCVKKKAQAKGWRDWLDNESGFRLGQETDWWRDEQLQQRLAPRLDGWLKLIRNHGGSQTEMIAQCPEEIRPVFQKRLRLMAPLVKAWKVALKTEGAVDFAGLVHQAIDILEKGRFISPWKHILVDELQDISPQRSALLLALARQNKQTHLFATGDDRQAIYRFSSANPPLLTDFSRYFDGGETQALDTTYRFNGRIGEVANRFIQADPLQQTKSLNSLTKGDRRSVLLMPESQLEALLDKMSGYVRPEQRILLLARYHYLRPFQIAWARTRWPRLQIDFMTLHASKGQQADYVIVLGLNEGLDGFPAPARATVLEQGLLPEAEVFPDAEERRLLYVALTRARHRVWLLFDSHRPSVFVEDLKKLAVPVIKKP